MAADKTSQIAQCIASGSSPPANEGVALAVVVFLFIGAAMWMFHRYGAQRPQAAAEGQAVDLESPALAPAPS